MEMMKRLIVEEEGQGMVEYGLITGLIAIIAVFIFSDTGGVRPALEGLYSDLADKIKFPGGGGDGGGEG
ncbi:Flp family type IVb pilin [Anaerobacillus sp. MEB173]|uniref:Flp family type IVb pilin n=1 Tax=Anaerobacillus sp. MEB173 TaxID=3383345 RepID=UPI003F92C06B